MQFDPTDRYREGTARQKMPGVSVCRMRYCTYCKQHKHMHAGFKAKPIFKCVDCVKGNK